MYYTFGSRTMVSSSSSSAAAPRPNQALRPFRDIFEFPPVLQAGRRLPAALEKLPTVLNDSSIGCVRRSQGKTKLGALGLVCQSTLGLSLAELAEPGLHK